ncbi:X2-like carbohydrate binding domain-containing protein [Paenibacillus sedimenti]|nr:X2-like carbohydrate binding domain-containing protein [Paenibacillus sedimenti]
MEADVLAQGRISPLRWLLKAMLFLFVVITVFWFAANVARAATYTVNTTTSDTNDANPGDGSCDDISGRCSLRAAIMEANAASGLTTIIVPPGTYTLSRGSALSITGNVTIIGSGGNPNGDPKLTIIQSGTSAGSGASRVFDINPNLDKDLNVTIQSVWIRYGKASGGYGGGGIAADAGTNAAVNNTILIDNCYISENTSSSASDGGGGLNLTAGKSNGLLKVTRTTVTNNTAIVGYGGGIYVQSFGPFQLDASTIENNTSTARGGGGLFFGGIGGSAITNSTINLNTAPSTSYGYGGGIYTAGALTMSNTTINGNIANRNGGGIYIETTLASLFSNDTINANESNSGNGGGIYISNAGNVELNNNIVAGNIGSGGAAGDISGNPLNASSTSNLIGTGGAGGLTNGVNDNQIGVTNLLLGPLANNGGTTKTQALLPGSPALDAGKNESAPASGLDQRGFARKAHAAGAGSAQIIDIGAFEANPTIQTIADQTMNGGETLQVPFYVGDVSIGAVTTTAASGNLTLLPVSGLNVSGTGASRTLSVTPAPGQQGTTPVTITALSSVTGQSVTVTFNLTVIGSSTISPTTGNFDKKLSAQADVITTMTLNGNTLSGIANGATGLVLGADYTVSGNTVTIKKEYLASQSIGTTVLTFSFSAGAIQTITITVSDSTSQNSTISPTTGSFEKKLSAQSDVIITMTLNGNTLSSIANGATVLVQGTDYTVSGNTVTIKKEYLSTQPVGTIVLTFSFSAGSTQTLTITVSDTTPQNSTISPTTSNFDKSAQVDVSTTMTLNGNTLSSITNGAATLALGTDYTVSGNRVAIKKEYLASQSVGTTVLTFNFSAGATQTLTITVSDTTPQNSTISPITGSFDKKVTAQADVIATMTLNGNTLSGIANGAAALALGTDYTVSGNTVAIKKEYLASQSVGTTVLTFNFSAGATQTLTITISDTTPQNSTISPTTGSFDKKASAQADVTTTMTLNGNTLSSIANGAAALALGKDYTVSGNTVTIKKEYLASQAEGTTVLTFTFSAGATQTLTITVSDITSQNSTISPTTGDFDKSAQADVITTMTLNGNTLSSIANGTMPLVSGTDYTVAGLTVTIKKEYLTTQPVGTTQLTFNFSAGATQTLTITISDTTPQNSTINPTTGNFNKSAQLDLIITMTLNGNTLSSIANGITALVADTDYTVTGNMVTIKKEYLATQPVGTTQLTFNFSAGATQTFTITVSDGLPAPKLQASVGDSQVTLSWDSVTGATYYAIYQGLAPRTYNIDPIATVTGTTYNVTNLTNGTTYYFAVIASNALGISQYSKEAVGIPRASDSDPPPSSGSGSSLSSNTALKIIKFIAVGKELTISPTGVADTNAEQIEVQAEPEDSGSVVSLTVQGKALLNFKQVPLSEGENTVIISVKAPDGSAKSYTYTIRRTVAPKPPACTFKDIRGHWAETIICKAASEGIVQGVSAFSFHPDVAVTRAEFVTMLIRSMQGLSTATTAHSFTDQADIPNWAQQAIHYAVTHGIVDGYPDGTFRPQNTLSRMEVAALIARALKLKIEATGSTAFSDDFDIPAWAKPYVQADVQQGLLQGRDNNRFMPNENTTRAEAATIILSVKKAIRQ